MGLLIIGNLLFITEKLKYKKYIEKKVFFKKYFTFLWDYLTTIFSGDFLLNLKTIGGKITFLSFILFLYFIFLIYLSQLLINNHLECESKLKF